MRRFLIVAAAVAASTLLGAPAQALVTVPTAAGINITVAEDFAPKAQALIADAVAHGQKFSRITCHSHARSHVRGSNHHGGRACDPHPAISAALVRKHGLRSGCDFHDCAHFDDATNVGGVAYWNSIKHGGPTVTASAHSRHRYRVASRNHYYHSGRRYRTASYGAPPADRLTASY